MKFWLNVSRDQQRRRFLSRIDEPNKNWKFEIADVRERGFRDQCINAYEEALNETFRPRAQWFAIPADSKPVVRVAVAEIIVKSLSKLGLEYPYFSSEVKSKFSEMRRMLEREE